MITIEVALIITAGMIGGPIILLMLSNHNWFKKEAFKFKQATDRKEFNIRFKAMERDLKVKEIPPIPPREKTLIEQAQGINPETLKSLAGLLTKDDAYEGDYEEPEKTEVIDVIANFVDKNPDISREIIDKITGVITKKPEGGGNDQTYQG